MKITHSKTRRASIVWEEENAEAMLQLRGLVLTGRWNNTFTKITASLAADRRLDWRWQSPAVSSIPYEISGTFVHRIFYSVFQALPVF